MKIRLRGPGIDIKGTCTPEIGAGMLKLVEGSKRFKVKVTEIVRRKRKQK